MPLPAQQIQQNQARQIGGERARGLAYSHDRKAPRAVRSGSRGQDAIAVVRARAAGLGRLK